MGPSFIKTKTGISAKSLKKLFFVVLANIRSRENVVSIFRTADAAGVSKIFLCGITPQPPHEKISKTALGAEESMAWEYHFQAWRLLRKFKKDGYTILALEQTPESKNIFEYILPAENSAAVTNNLYPKFTDPHSNNSPSIPPPLFI